MDNQRILLWAALGFLLLQVWTSWQLDYGPRPAPPVATTDTTTTADTGIIDQPEAVPESDDLPTPVQGATTETTA